MRKLPLRNMALRGSPQRKVLIGTVAVALTAATIAFMPPALAQVASAVPSETEAVIPSDSLPNPLGDKAAAMREEAVAGVLSGRLTPQTINGSKVVKLGKSGNHVDEYVELAREGTDRIFVILAEFGNTRNVNYPDVDTDPNTAGPVTWDGPLVNQIPSPDRKIDNSTVHRPDFSQSYFEDLYFGGGESVKNYFETQSSGRYSVDGTVTDWVKVQFNQARYGRSNGFPCASIVCNNTWFLVRDAANQWVADQLAAGQTLAQVQAELATFDVHDRYDWNGNGNFNEPDGFLDHFQIVHAGGDQADGDPIYGEDAIWSHRWYAALTLGPHPGFPGTQIGAGANATGFWIGDYTIQPENGGRSVFYHEYTHDLGLPDDYNILSGGDNNNEHWTLMAQSRLGAKDDGGIGERGGDLGAWNKLQLGWLNFDLVDYNESKTIDLGPQEYNTAKPQAVVVALPQKSVEHELGAPASGTFQWYSGHANSSNLTLATEVTLGAAPNTLTFQTRFDIEDCHCDYGYVEVDTGGGNWTPINGTFTRPAEGEGIAGVQVSYASATFDLSAYSNSSVGLRFRYATDPAVAGNDGEPAPDGWLIDDIAINGTVINGAEADDAAWTATGWSRLGATYTTLHDNFYIAGHRSYVGYDKYLETGPYYFGYLNTRPDYVDHYNYQEGLLISYWDTSYEDNDTFAHPGNGRNLYIDAHPQIMIREGATPWRSRIQVYDAPFGLHPTDGMVLHQSSSVRVVAGGLQGAHTFDDTGTYWFASLPNHGVLLPAVGVTIQVLDVKGTSMTVQVN